MFDPTRWGRSLDELYIGNIKTLKERKGRNQPSEVFGCNPRFQDGVCLHNHCIYIYNIAW